ncbi:DNA glycosylase [Cladorrhinum sp. PSN332]|nr:DNA glycosylase [Cladorrhinum sp. PSN332]
MRKLLVGRVSQTMTAPIQRRQPSRAAKLSTTVTPLKPGKPEPVIKIKPDEQQTLTGIKRSTSYEPEQTTPKKKLKTEIKSESPNSLNSIPPIIQDNKHEPTQTLTSKKLLSYTKHGPGGSPFPEFSHPTPSECALALRILTSLHGPRSRPKPGTLKAGPANRAGCGDSPSVLDALVRTILSQNTSDVNSSRAKKSMDAVYGRSDNWEGIVSGGPKKLEEAIRCGGLSVVKSKVIFNLLEEAQTRYGSYSLESLREIKDNDEVMKELLSFKGVGPKTASCVMLFSLGRESFAVDTHVWRISGLIGWRPGKASRDETHLHLDARIPDEMKFGLHVLMVTHGKRCAECKAGAVVPQGGAECKLRRAFAGGGKEVKCE